MSTDHAHPVDPAAVAQARAALPTTPAADQLARLLALLADPVRTRTLFGLVAVPELCVGDIALTLDVSMDQASYALKQLRASGLVATRKDGRAVYYRLAEGFPHQLLEHCLLQLLTVSRR